jgi:hypothetical protein
MPYSEVDDRPWIINSNEDTANTAMESEISSGLRPKKRGTTTLYVTRFQ